MSDSPAGDLHRRRTPPPTPLELGESLARMVWEGFSDDLADADVQALFASLDVPVKNGIPAERTFEELLIFHLWIHTRTVQLAFDGREPDERIRDLLDHLHRAIFDDLVENGTPDTRLPGFEQRARARYVEYYAAARESPAGLGKMLARHLAGSNRKVPNRVVEMLTARALTSSQPLRDFLDDLELDAEP